MCCVHNIILGKLWIEQYGTVEIVNHRYSTIILLNILIKLALNQTLLFFWIHWSALEISVC